MINIQPWVVHYESYTDTFHNPEGNTLFDSFQSIYPKGWGGLLLSAPSFVEFNSFPSVFDSTTPEWRQNEGSRFLTLRYLPLGEEVPLKLINTDKIKPTFLSWKRAGTRAQVRDDITAEVIIGHAGQTDAVRTRRSNVPKVHT